MSFVEELKRRNVIRVAIAYALIAWVVLQAADFGLDLIDAPNWMIQSVFLMAVIGLPIVILIAWVFELTPEGIKREAEVDRSESITPQTRRKLDVVIMATLLLAVGYLLLDKMFLQPRMQASDQPVTESAEKPSVAVLPFVNMSNDTQNEYFSDGLTETLLHMLAQLPDLQVAARTSSFTFKGTNQSIPEIAGQLGVRHILEGSVQKANDQVRVTAQLIRADDGFHVWSQNYTRPLDDIFTIQDAIAGDVADALGATLLGSADQRMEGIHTSDISAYDYYLKGLEAQALFSYSSLPEARGLFKQALAQDPEFTDAMLALSKNRLMEYSTGIINADELTATMSPLIEQTLMLEPGNARARAYQRVLQLITPNAKFDSDAVEGLITELRELLAVVPTETLVRLVVSNTLLNFFRDPVSAEEVLQGGLLVDPLDDKLHAQLGKVYQQAGQLDKSQAALERSLELEPGNPNTYWDLFELESDRNHLAKALQWGIQATEVDPQDHELAAQLAAVYYRLDLPEEGDRWNNRVQALAPASGLAAKLQVQQALVRGDEETAIRLAEQAIRNKIDNRQNAFFDTAFTYANVQSQRGQAEQAYQLMAEVYPSITRYDQLAPEFKAIMLQWVSVLLMADFKAQQEQRDAWNALVKQFEAMGFPWNDPEEMGLTTHLLINGDIEAATEAFLAGPLSQPLASNLYMPEQELPNLYQDLYSDPRVEARFMELNQQYQQMRGEVIAMLEQAELNP